MARERYRHAATRWGLGILACLAAAIVAFALPMAVPSLLDAVVYLHVALLVALVVCTLMFLVRLVQSFIASPIEAERKPPAKVGVLWWGLVAEAVGITAVIIGGIMLTDVGMRQGWLPSSRPIAEGIMSSLAGVFIITAIMVWAIFLSPAFAGRKGLMLVVTALAAAASAAVGLIGSNLRWQPFVSTISGRGAGVILGAVFMGIWLAGYRLTKRTSTPG
jgi:hypothetical protein